MLTLHNQAHLLINTRNLFVVRKPMVVDALRWLKENNLYSDVNIDESVIESNECPVNNEPEEILAICLPNLNVQ